MKQGSTFPLGDPTRCSTGSGTPASNHHIHMPAALPPHIAPMLINNDTSTQTPFSNPPLLDMPIHLDRQDTSRSLASIYSQSVSTCQYHCCNVGLHTHIVITDVIPHPCANGPASANCTNIRLVCRWEARISVVGVVMPRCWLRQAAHLAILIEIGVDSQTPRVIVEGRRRGWIITWQRDVKHKHVIVVRRACRAHHHCSHQVHPLQGTHYDYQRTSHGWVVH